MVIRNGALMVQYDVIIVGTGPAGLTAGLYLTRGKRNVMVLEKDAFGGPMRNIPQIDNYPGFAQPVAGSTLSSEMVKQATHYGLKLELGEVTGIDTYGSCHCVICADGKSYTTNIIIIAGGTLHKKLNVPGEKDLMGKGLFHCALCDGSKFENQVVGVCGGGNSGVTESIYLSNIAEKVLIFEAMPVLSASAVLRERIEKSSNIIIRSGVSVKKILGKDALEGIEIIDGNGDTETINLGGLLVEIGLEPNTGYLKDLITLDESGWIVVNEKMETDSVGILAAGDIRRGSLRQIVTAVGDGAVAAGTAERLLQDKG